MDSCGAGRNLVCTGGTARAVFKLAKHLGFVPENADSMTKEVFDDVGKLLLKDKKKAADIILKVSPERIHTMIPGYMILRHIQRQFGSDVMTAAEYGVREGYLCRKILK